MPRVSRPTTVGTEWTPPACADEARSVVVTLPTSTPGHCHLPDASMPFHKTRTPRR